MYARYYSRKENKLGVPYPKLSFFVFDVGKCCRKTFLIANAIEQFGSYCHQYDGFVASTFRYHIDWISVSCFLCVSFYFASTYRLVVFCLCVDGLTNTTRGKINIPIDRVLSAF